VARCREIALIVSLCACVAGYSGGLSGWWPNGVGVSTGWWNEESPNVTTDGSGGAIIVWQDNRQGSTATGDLYAKRITSDGVGMWTANGVPVSRADMKQDGAAITADGSGGAFIVWQDQRNHPVDMFHDIYAQRIDPTGAVLWATDGIPICIATGDRWAPVISSDGSGGAIIAWQDSRGPTTRIYAQRVDATGSTMWTANGIAVCGTYSSQLLPRMAVDGAGGAIVTWHDDRNGNWDIFAQRIDGAGSVQWSSSGAAICVMNGSQHTTHVVSDGAGGAIVIWNDYRSGTSYDIYAQRVDPSGSAVWTGGGVPICTDARTQWNPNLVRDGSGGAIITWYDDRSGTMHVYVQRVAANGAVAWETDGFAICDAGGSQSGEVIVSDGAGGAIISWADSRSTYGDIYAQRVDSSGAPRWAVDGVAMCTAAGTQMQPCIVPDGSGGAVIAWEDWRSNTSSDLYAQRVDAAGHTVVATLLQSFAVAFSGDGISITWTLSEVDRDAEFFIERADAARGPFVELLMGSLSCDGLSFLYVDREWESGTTYWYRVGYRFEGERRILFESNPITTPTVPLALYQNYPNPFNPSTDVRYYLPERCRVALEIFDVSGTLVARLAEGFHEKGPHTVSWDGRDRSGRPMNSGVYFYRLTAGKTQLSKKMVLAR
jgi:hypothetical protein